MKKTLKLDNFGRTFVVSYVSDSPITEGLEEKLNEKLKDIYLSTDLLGIVFGIHFGLDITTINGRKYLAETWLNLFEDPEFQENLKLGKYVGTIGHDTRPISDNDFRDKIISHVYKNMWAEDGQGYAIALVKNNELGKELRSNLISGVFMKPSTRGKVTNPGDKVMRPDNYTFLGIDYVINPAYPSTDIIYLDIEEIQENTESTNESIETELQFDGGNTDMNGSEEVLNELRIQRDNLTIQLQNKDDEIKKLNEEITNLKIELAALVTAKATAETQANESAAQFERISTAYTNRLSKYRILENKVKQMEASANESTINYDELARKIAETQANESTLTLDELKAKIKEGFVKEFEGNTFKVIEVTDPLLVDGKVIEDCYLLLDEQEEIIEMQSDEFKSFFN